MLTAREYASWRKARDGIEGKLGTKELVASCKLDERNLAFFEETCTAAHMSGRGIIRTLSVARTIADMGESNCVSREHLCEALHFRKREGAPVE